MVAESSISFKELLNEATLHQKRLAELERQIRALSEERMLVRGALVYLQNKIKVLQSPPPDGDGE